MSANIRVKQIIYFYLTVPLPVLSTALCVLVFRRRMWIKQSFHVDKLSRGMSFLFIITLWVSFIEPKWYWCLLELKFLCFNINNMCCYYYYKVQYKYTVTLYNTRIASWRTSNNIWINSSFLDLIALLSSFESTLSRYCSTCVIPASCSSVSIDCIDSYASMIALPLFDFMALAIIILLSKSNKTNSYLIPLLDIVGYCPHRSVAIYPFNW